MTTAPTIRLARPDEVDRVRELEDWAGEIYAEAGLPPDLPGIERDVVERARAAGLLWVVDDDAPAVGFALCWVRPGALHLRELDVHPEHMRRGLGRRLVEHVSSEAAKRGLAQVTLTTFRDVPWNAPLYRRWGFEEIGADEMPGWLAEIRAEEDAGVLSAWPRVAMGRASRR